MMAISGRHHRPGGEPVNECVEEKNKKQFTKKMPPRPRNNAAPPAPPPLDPHILADATHTVSRSLAAAAANAGGASEAALAEAGAAVLALAEELAVAAEVAGEAVGASTPAGALQRDALLLSLEAAAGSAGEAGAGLAGTAAGMRGSAAALAAHADAYAFPAALVQPPPRPPAGKVARGGGVTNLVAATTNFEGLLSLAGVGER
jgi:hypothetical protein